MRKRLMIVLNSAHPVQFIYRIEILLSTKTLAYRRTGRLAIGDDCLENPILDKTERLADNWLSPRIVAWQ
jgi:hypothetical protein